MRIIRIRWAVSSGVHRRYTPACIVADTDNTTLRTSTLSVGYMQRSLCACSFRLLLAPIRRVSRVGLLAAVLALPGVAWQMRSHIKVAGGYRRGDDEQYLVLVKRCMYRYISSRQKLLRSCMRTQEGCRKWDEIRDNRRRGYILDSSKLQQRKRRLFSLVLRSPCV